MSTLGFEDYVEPLKVHLQNYQKVGGRPMRVASCCLLRIAVGLQPTARCVLTLWQPHGTDVSW